MDLPKAYSPSDYEDSLYQKWEKSGAFSPRTEGTPFVITMPPPNATGQLHMGHAAMLALEDLMIRYHRMKGDAALWVPGTDHAGIATQNMAEKMLKKESGKTRHEIGREAFVEYTRTFAEDSKSRIRNQVRKMGASCDWSRERYTLDEQASKAVREAFVRMYEDGLIYRGYRIVNWCTRCASTLADDEVEYVPETTKFYYLKYGPVVIGTARPETKFADKVIIVHPDDKRYESYHGKTLTVPWITGDVEATFIADESADMKLGTGAMTITPAHSFIDFDLAQKYKLEIVKIIDEEGKITDIAGPEFAGLDASTEARKKVVAALKKKGLVERIDEHYEHNLSVCYRCKTPVQPLPSKQWFVDVNKAIKVKGDRKPKSLKERASAVVKKGTISIVPDRFNKVYFHWMDNLRDWCISRQIWWGHRIPAWRCSDCNEWIVTTETPDKCKCGSSSLRQDEDTLDTWFSSSLWTFSTLGWPEKTTDLKRFHPTSVMETGYDILFFWVARMIIMSTYLRGEIPFDTVYLHGLVRDRDGDKMSKSKPETMIDPLKVCSTYGTDAVRLSLIIGSAPGGDMRLYEEKIAGFRNFTNKVWNVARFILMNCAETSESLTPEPKTLADHWILSRVHRVIGNVTEHLEHYKFSEGGMAAYDFLWGELADWYVEVSKIEKNEQVLRYALDTLLKLLHPWMPFVTEQLWALSGHEEMLITAPWPRVEEKYLDPDAEKSMSVLMDVIEGIRSLRSDAEIPVATHIRAILVTSVPELIEEHRDTIIKMARLSSLEIAGVKPSERSVHKALPHSQIYLPVAGVVDLDAERKKVAQEIAETEKYIAGIEARLSNKAFVKKAPESVVAQDRTKLAQSTEKLAKLKERLEEFV